MIKELIIIVFLLIAYLMTFSLCAAAKRGDQYPEECRYNLLEGCRGKCCKNCELYDVCKLACKDNPEDCGGRINRYRK